MDPYMEYLRGGAPESARAFPNANRSAETDQPPDGFRARLRGNAPQDPTTVPPELAEEAAYLMQRMMTLLHNTNFTAAQPAYNAPHYWSQPFDMSARYTVPAAAGAYVAALTYTVPDPYCVRIAQYGFNVRDDTYTYNGDILFQVVKNGSVVPGLQDISEQRGSLVLPADTFIIGQSVYNDVISFQVRRAVAAAATTEVDVTLRGWTWRPLSQKSGPAIGIPQ